VLATRGNATTKAARLSTWRRSQQRPCLWRLIVGCSNEDSRDFSESKSDASMRVGAAEQGTWIVGDQQHMSPGSLHEHDNGHGFMWNFKFPKIFTDYGGPYNCSSGAQVTPAQLQHALLSDTELLAPPASDSASAAGLGVSMTDALCWGKLHDVQGFFEPAKPLPCCSDMPEDASGLPDGNCRVVGSDGCPPTA
jgi:hypothetical protein